MPAAVKASKVERDQVNPAEGSMNQLFGSATL
jgi:hypothetical protein